MIDLQCRAKMHAPTALHLYSWQQQSFKWTIQFSDTTLLLMDLWQRLLEDVLAHREASSDEDLATLLHEAIGRHAAAASVHHAPGLIHDQVLMCS